ncbi:Chromate resistance protein ChrB [Clostridium folliculivorans]|uniref:ChrB N-terminal domain-containing protein n=1 Tax=Clostridium folliculivorans TaxID=2886038 RepID=A0A9W5Y024_9CLOT|nr:Chromate resistance protein ChrB [Clostridium folliculivorans]GKU24128.1 hypothetical protein CFOLD11_09540 [Clostridium folliculivorans]GKU30234.1 hypothetical protein CFB3_23410 [Clostridium folliculivorans]
MEEWLAINFTLPREPSRIRVSIWRKLKRTGSINIGQSIWVLPLNDEHIKIFNEIAAEVKENYGQSFVMKTDFLLDQSDQPIVDYFNNARDEEYKEFLEKCKDFKQEIQKETEKNNFSFAEIEENEHELRKLNIWLEAIIKRDFFNSSMKEESETTLINCKDILENYCNEVYVRNGAL